MFFITCSVCVSTVSSANFMVSGTRPMHPEQYRVFVGSRTIGSLARYNIYIYINS
jgi:hypothetical protein